MSDLDRELTDILYKASGGISDMAQDEIAAIKQAVDKHVIPAQRNDTHHNAKITALITGYNQSSNDARKALYGGERKEV